jgi:hypothetical protein
LPRSEHGDLVGSAAEFERTGVLEVLEFQVSADFGGIFEGSFPDIRMDPGVGSQYGGMHSATLIVPCGRMPFRKNLPGNYRVFPIKRRIIVNQNTWRSGL